MSLRRRRRVSMPMANTRLRRCAHGSAINGMRGFDAYFLVNYAGEDDSVHPRARAGSRVRRDVRRHRRSFEKAG